jgi:hypothetical protein
MIDFIIKLCIMMIGVVYYKWPIEMHVCVSHLVHKQLLLSKWCIVELYCMINYLIVVLLSQRVINYMYLSWTHMSVLHFAISSWTCIVWSIILLLSCISNDGFQFYIHRSLEDTLIINMNKSSHQSEPHL